MEYLGEGVGFSLAFPFGMGFISPPWICSDTKDPIQELPNSAFSSVEDLDNLLYLL